MALRSALSLGINLRLTDTQTPEAAKEARARLWWSIYSLEHLLTSVTGRASSVTDSICSVPAPFPCEEETFEHPEARRLLQDPTLREAHLRPTLFEASNQVDLPIMDHSLSTLSIPLLPQPRRPKSPHPSPHKQSLQHRRPPPRALQTRIPRSEVRSKNGSLARETTPCIPIQPPRRRPLAP